MLGVDLVSQWCYGKDMLPRALFFLLARTDVYVYLWVSFFWELEFVNAMVYMRSRFGCNDTLLGHVCLKKVWECSAWCISLQWTYPSRPTYPRTAHDPLSLNGQRAGERYFIYQVRRVKKMKAVARYRTNSFPSKTSNDINGQHNTSNLRYSFRIMLNRKRKKKKT